MNLPVVSQLLVDFLALPCGKGGGGGQSGCRFCWFGYDFHRGVCYILSLHAYCLAWTSLSGLDWTFPGVELVDRQAGRSIERSLE